MARNFDGVDDVLYTASPSLPNADWTIMFWARAETEGEGGQGRFFGWQSGGWGLFGFRSGEVNMPFVEYYAGTAVSQILGSTDDIVLNTWQHWTIRYRVSDDTLDMLLDGVSLNTSTTNPGTATLSQLTVGAGDPVGGFTTDGDMAEFKIFNSRFTTDEILAERAGLRVRTPYLHWPIYGLDDPEPDLSGNKLNATTVTGAVASNHSPQVPYSRRFWGHGPLIEQDANELLQIPHSFSLTC